MAIFVVLTILFVVFFTVGIGVVVEEEGGDGTGAVFGILFVLGLIASLSIEPFGFVIAYCCFSFLLEQRLRGRASQ